LKKQLQEHAARAFDADIRRHTPDVREPEIEKLHARIGHLSAEQDFLARVSRMNAPDRRALVDREECRVGL
jgi:transposase